MKINNEEEYIEAKESIREYEKINDIIFPYNIHVGDTVAYVSNSKRFGNELINVKVTESFLSDLIKYEGIENFHQFRIVKKYDE